MHLTHFYLSLPDHSTADSKENSWKGTANVLTTDNIRKSETKSINTNCNCEFLLVSSHSLFTSGEQATIIFKRCAYVSIT